MTDVAVRPTAVAGAFYPADPGRLGQLVAGLFEEASVLAASPAGGGGGLPLGLLVPHAGLVYSGVVAAAGWACVDLIGGEPVTIVILGTNHSAGWLDGVGAWDGGSWAGPGGETEVDGSLVAEVVALGAPFIADRAAHLGEHSIEVQLPLLAAVAPGARIVPLAVACGTGRRATDAGDRLGRLLAARRAAGERLVLVISTDMAHYPAASACAEATERLLPPIISLGAAALARLEASMRDARIPGLACGMCGIEPAVLGLAALRAMGATTGVPLAAATSADAGGPANRTVGYLAVRFDA
jgi:AmmeMemoRadiSam system protein B